MLALREGCSHHGLAGRADVSLGEVRSSAGARGGLFFGYEMVITHPFPWRLREWMCQLRSGVRSQGFDLVLPSQLAVLIASCQMCAAEHAPPSHRHHPWPIPCPNGSKFPHYSQAEPQHPSRTGAPFPFMLKALPGLFSSPRGNLICSVAFKKK